MKKPFFILLVILSSCFPTEKQRPSDILNRREMVDVLIDIHLLEAKVKRLYLPSDSSKIIYNHYEEMLFKDMGITSEQYNQSLEYYLENMEEFKSIYDEVVDSLLARQKTYRE